MGQQTILYTGPMLDAEPPHHPEPCMVSYGGVTCFPHPYSCHAMLPPPGNRTTFDPCYLPENLRQHPYMITQYYCEHCNTFMMPSPNASVLSVPVNHDHFPFSNHHHIFERNRSLFVDGSSRVFKRTGSLVAIPMPSQGNRVTGDMGFDYDPMVVHNSSHLVHGELVQAVPTPWLDQHSASGGFSWNPVHGVPYLQDIALHGYQIAAMSRNPPTFVHPPPMRPCQGTPNVYHSPLHPLPTMSALQPQNLDNQSQLQSTSHRHFTSTSTTYPFQNNVGPGPRFVSPIMPHDLMVYQDLRQPLMIDSMARHYSFPHLSFLPVDEQGEQFGNMDSGVSDDIISDHVKTRIFDSSRTLAADEEPNFCVICQMDFEDQEKIRVLHCRHEYHVDCIKKWLAVKNNCPICKSTAFN